MTPKSDRWSLTADLRPLPPDFPVIIRQCIPADRPKAHAFLQSIFGDAAVAGNFPFELQLSLVASEGDAIIGVALYRAAGDSRGRELAVAAVADHHPLVQSLVDKAMTKLHAHGVSKCKVVFLNREEPLFVWEQSRWAGTLAPDEPTPTLAGKPAEMKPEAAAA